ncbi:MAG: universal stress protein [Chloroflexi bacterium]|nr:MAG: universal stress protein [Chloroflexota bacterium]TMC27488.1 MAG: universal stress protein [Chloroflexota bacterium]TMC35888.1 MAG: universal stress protein [Chloroflexota bacterium]TME36168.1 MAG: universal stress protein [Chloroflexota bacterium]
MQLRRIVVPLGGTAVDADVIKVAATLAKANKAQVTAIHVIEVRWNLALDAVLDAETERGEVLLDEAAKVAQQAGVTIETELLQARDAAAAIIDTARERDADLILLGMPFRKRLGRVYVGRTVTNVYVGAPCAVLAYRQEEVG